MPEKKQDWLQEHGYLYIFTDHKKDKFICTCEMYVKLKNGN